VNGAVLGSKAAVLGDVFAGDTVGDNPALQAALGVFGTGPLGEAPLVGSHDGLTAGELELGATQSLNDVVGGGVLSSHRVDDLANGNAGSHLGSLTVRTSHTGRQTIGTGARKHLVLSDHVVRVDSAADVVTLLTGGLHQVLVAGHTGGLQGASRKLLLLARHQVAHERESINVGLLGTAVENSDLSIRNTSQVPRLDVRLVLLESHATGRSSSHVCYFKDQIRINIIQLLKCEILYYPVNDITKPFLILE
jgi:hypothetical protein